MVDIQVEVKHIGLVPIPGAAARGEAFRAGRDADPEPLSAGLRRIKVVDVWLLDYFVSFLVGSVVSLVLVLVMVSVAETLQENLHQQLQQQGELCVQGVWVLEVQEEQGWVAEVFQGLDWVCEEVWLVFTGLNVTTTKNRMHWFNLLCVVVRHQDICLPP